MATKKILAKKAAPKKVAPKKVTPKKAGKPTVKGDGIAEFPRPVVIAARIALVLIVVGIALFAINQ